MLLDAHCPSCHHEARDIFYKGSFNAEREAKALTCPQCSERMIKAAPITGSTPSEWGDTAWGYYDRGLGARVESKAHHKALMAAKGVEPL